MAETKGSSMVFFRDSIEKLGAAQAALILQRLPPEEAKRLRHAIPAGWYPIETVTHVLTEAARALYPGDGGGLRRLGQALAQNHLKGIYRILLKIMTVPFLINQVANLWRTYHKQGVARVEPGATAKDASLIIAEYPDLPAEFREMLCGYVVGALELTQARNVRVTHQAGNPQAWRWTAVWE